MHVKQSLLGFDIGQALQGHPNTLQGFVLHNGDRHFVGLINIGKQLVVEILFFWLLLWELAIDFYGVTLPPHFLWRLLLQFAPSNSDFEILTWLGYNTILGSGLHHITIEPSLNQGKIPRL